MLPFQKQPIDFVTFENAGGTLHLLKLGYITVQEQAAIESEILKSSQISLKLLKLVQKICVNEGISREEAAAILDNPLSNPAVSSKYTEEIEDILQIQADLGARGRLQEVTAIIRFRTIHPDAFDDSGKILPSVKRDYLGIPGWGEADTLLLDQEIYRQISEFADQERTAKKRISQGSPLTNKSSRLNSTSTEEPLTGLSSIGE